MWVFLEKWMVGGTGGNILEGGTGVGMVGTMKRLSTGFVGAGGRQGGCKNCLKLRSLVEEEGCRINGGRERQGLFVILARK